MMNVAIELPEDIACQLEPAWHATPRRALEAPPLQAYRSARQRVGRLLGLDFWQGETSLKHPQPWPAHNENDLSTHRAAIDRALSMIVVSNTSPHQLPDLIELCCATSRFSTWAGFAGPQAAQLAIDGEASPRVDRWIADRTCRPQQLLQYATENRNVGENIGFRILEASVRVHQC